MLTANQLRRFLPPKHNHLFDYSNTIIQPVRAPPIESIGIFKSAFSPHFQTGANRYPLALVCLALGGWGMLLYFSTTNTLVQRSVSNAMRGRVMGIWALVFGGMMPLGGFESGFLSHAVGVPWTITAGALVCAGAGLRTWWVVRRNPTAPRDPE